MEEIFERFDAEVKSALASFSNGLEEIVTKAHSQIDTLEQRVKMQTEDAQRKMDEVCDKWMPILKSSYKDDEE